MEDAVNGSAAGGSGPIVVAGAGYAGLHVALRLTARLRNRPQIELTLVDRHDDHQAVTELPRVAAGTRAVGAVRIPLQDVLATRVRFARTEITGFDLPGRRLLTGAGPIGWGRNHCPRRRSTSPAPRPGQRPGAGLSTGAGGRPGSAGCGRLHLR